MSEHFSSSKRQKTCLYLPKDIIGHILDFCVEYDRVHFSMVDKDWYEAAFQENYWETAYKTHWNIREDESQSWYDSYKNAWQNFSRPSYRNGPRRSNYYDGIAPSFPFKKIGSYPGNKSNYSLAQESVIIHHKCLYFIQTGALVCYNTTKGKAEWTLYDSYAGNSDEMLEIVVPRRMLIATCHNLAIIAYDLAGNLIWRYSATEKTSSISQFVIRNGVVIFAENHYKDGVASSPLFGISLETGALLWTSVIQYPGLGNVHHVCSCNDDVVFAYNRGQTILKWDTFKEGDFTKYPKEKPKYISFTNIHEEWPSIDCMMMIKDQIFISVGRILTMCNYKRSNVIIDEECPVVYCGDEVEGVVYCEYAIPGGGSAWDVDFCKFNTNAKKPHKKIPMMTGEDSTEIINNKDQWGDHQSKSLYGGVFSEMIVTKDMIVTLSLPMFENTLSVVGIEKEKGDLVFNAPISDMEYQYEMDDSVRFIMGKEFLVFVDPNGVIAIFTGHTAK